MKRNATKHALLMSAISLMLCVSMLVGTTFAWFTDSVTSANNNIQSGNLDVELYYHVEGKTDWTKVASDTNIFMKDALWEPGHTEVVKLKVVNEGSLALKYHLGVNVVSEEGSKNAAGKAFQLSDYIKFGIVEGAQDYTRDEAVAAVDATATALNTAYNSNIKELLPKVDDNTAEEDYTDIVTMVVYMPTSVGNDANHAKGEAQPTIQLGINLLATQEAYEEDSFNETYDNLAVFTDGTYRVNEAALTTTAATDESVTLANENKTFVVTATAGDTGKVEATITAAPTKVENGTAILSYDIDVTGHKPDSEVTVKLFIGQTLMDINLYHEGEAMPAADYSYDPVSGYVTLKTKSFSVYTIEYNMSDYVITSFDDIVKNQDANHVLGNDIEIANNGIIHFGAGTVNHLDLNGKTITATSTQYSFGAQQGGVLTLSGNGTANVGKGFYANKGDAEIIINGGTYNMTATGTLNGIKHHGLAQNNSKIVINDGTFISTVEDACLFFATSNARIEINGGFFENTADKTPDLLSMGTNKSNTNRIVLSGGTFVNYNPMNDRMCYTGEWPEAGEAAFSGPWMLIADGYIVVSETQSNGDVWYSVVPANTAN